MGVDLALVDDGEVERVVRHHVQAAVEGVHAVVGVAEELHAVDGDIVVVAVVALHLEVHVFILTHEHGELGLIVHLLVGGEGSLENQGRGAVLVCEGRFPALLVGVEDSRGILGLEVGVECVGAVGAHGVIVGQLDVLVGIVGEDGRLGVARNDEGRVDFGRVLVEFGRTSFLVALGAGVNHVHVGDVELLQIVLIVGRLGPHAVLGLSVRLVEGHRSGHVHYADFGDGNFRKVVGVLLRVQTHRHIDFGHERLQGHYVRTLLVEFHVVELADHGHAGCGEVADVAEARFLVDAQARVVGPGLEVGVLGDGVGSSALVAGVLSDFARLGIFGEERIAGVGGIGGLVGGVDVGYGHNVYGHIVAAHKETLVGRRNGYLQEARVGLHVALEVVVVGGLHELAGGFVEEEHVEGVDSLFELFLGAAGARSIVVFALVDLHHVGAAESDAPSGTLGGHIGFEFILRARSHGAAQRHRCTESDQAAGR